MTDTTTATVPLATRQAALLKATRKYRDDGFEVVLSDDRLVATLTRKKRIRPLVVILLSIFTLGLGLLYFAFKAANRKVETIVLLVDERGKVHRG